MVGQKTGNHNKQSRSIDDGKEIVLHSEEIENAVARTRRINGR